jgi:hypothetical protein
MSAFQDLMTALVARRPDQSPAEDERIVLAALAKHAHELAELQRLRMDELDLTGQKARIVGRIVGLIDPEVQR